MPQAEIRLTNRWGMHARIAFHFARICQTFSSRIRLGHDGEWADGKEIMDILALGAGSGSLLVVETEGEDGEAALDALSRFLLVDSKVL